MKVAAILYDCGAGPATDALVTEFARRLRRAGFKLAGAVQSNIAVADRSRCAIILEDLATGANTKASEDRGPLAQGCRLDAGALEDSVGLAAASLGPETDLVVVNRFGKRETEGHGFRHVIETAVLLGVPVLVALNRAHLEAWQAFVGDAPILLPPDVRALSDWCARMLTDRTAADAPLEGALERSECASLSHPNSAVTAIHPRIWD